MNIVALWAEIERDQAWRTDELRFFHNQLARFADEDDKRRFRKALILLLYSHFEGFCKFAFLHYIKAVNGENLQCKDVNAALAAATLSEVFKELRNPDKKAKEFRRALPDDSKLHRFAREREFVEESDVFKARTVTIPDDVVDTESNLKPIVLRKNLFRIGLEPDRFSALDGQIHKLLEFRNNIAHGTRSYSLGEREYEILRKDVFAIMTQVKRDVMAALSFQSYLRR